jgi:hypothetical protein
MDGQGALNVGNDHFRVFTDTNVATGANTISCTVSAQGTLLGVATSYSGVKNQAAEANEGTTEAASTTISDSLTTASSEAWVICAGAVNAAQAIAPTQGGNDRVEDQYSTRTIGISDEEIAAAGAETFGWGTSGGNQVWYMSCVSFEEQD